jgi:hypothetical protein
MPDKIIVHKTPKGGEFYIELNEKRLSVYPEKPGFHLCLNDETGIDHVPTEKERFCYYEPETGNIHYARLEGMGASYAPEGKVAYEDYSYITVKSGIKKLVYLGKHDPEAPSYNKPPSSAYIRAQMDILALGEAQRKRIAEIYEDMYGLAISGLNAGRKTVEYIDDPVSLKSVMLVRALKTLHAEQSAAVQAALAGEPEPAPAPPPPSRPAKLLPFRRP